MNWLTGLLTNRNFIFLFALGLGLLFPQAAGLTKPLTLPALTLVLTFSTMAISNSILRSPRELFLPAVAGIAMSYLLLGNFIIALSAAFIREDNLWKGFVLMAAVPPAIAVIPFSAILKGNARYALFGTVGAYLGGLILLPLIVIGLIGARLINPFDLVNIVLQLVALPLLLSRLLIWKGWNLKLEPVKGTIINWLFFLILYTATGLNQDILMGLPGALLPVALIAFASTFLLGFLIKLIGRFFHVSADILTSLVLLGTLKNYGIAGGLALTFLSRESVLPATMGTFFMIFYVMWLDFRKD
ncbi:MAG: hypothetical protein U1C55_09295 [Smithellaceae bacterium]|nr:hypothetical protein [Smithellaceae bacterium]